MTVVSATSVIHHALKSRADAAVSALEARTCHSWKMNLDRVGVLPRREESLSPPSLKLCLRGGNGGRVVDFDGNSFIDLTLGFGSQILGHGVPSVQSAVVAQATEGWHCGLANERELELARYIQSCSGANERVMFCNSGDDATACAIRLARAYTGRDVVGVFAGSSHGSHDYGIAGEEPLRVSAGSADTASLYARPPGRRPLRHPGVPQAVLDTTINLTYGHPSAFDLVRRRRRDLAAVIAEPVRARDPSFDHVAWLRELAGVCGEAGVLLILDERLTGFRLAFGGAQERFGLMADLVAYGETVGGGLPLGAVAGRADVIAAAETEPAARAGLERGSSVSMLSVAAGAATLEQLATRREAVYPSLDERTRLLAHGLNTFAEENDIPARARYAGSIFRIQLTASGGEGGQWPGRARADSAFHALLMSEGVLIHPARLGFLATAHSAADIAQTTAAFQAALSGMKADGLFERTA